MKNQSLLTILTIYVAILGFAFSIYGTETILYTIASIGVFSIVLVIILMFLSVGLDIIILIIDSINRLKKDLK